MVLVFFMLAAPISVADAYPKLQYYVTDLAGALTLEEERAIEELCVIVYESCGAEIAVLVVNTTRPDDINIFATRTFQQNGLGQEGEDNGLLVLVATEDRLWRIEVGYGFEGALPDAKVGDLATTYLVPSLEQGAFYTGIYEVVDHLGGEIIINYDGNSPHDDTSPYPISWIPLTLWQLFVVGAVIVALAVLTRGRIILLSLLFLGGGRGKKRWGGGRTGGGGARGGW
jgi:uncharacterized protein